MNAEQLKGKWMQFTGELNRQWDKFVDNEPNMPCWRSEGTTTSLSEKSRNGMAINRVRSGQS